jgi:hypothetical protein
VDGPFRIPVVADPKHPPGRITLVSQHSIRGPRYEMHRPTPGYDFNPLPPPIQEDAYGNQFIGSHDMNPQMPGDIKRRVRYAGEDKFGKPTYKIEGLPGTFTQNHPEVVQAEKEHRVARDMTRGEAMVLMKNLAKVIAEGEKLIAKYGEDHTDGTVVRFVKQFPVGGMQYPDAPQGTRAYFYAAIRASGKWYLTGPTNAGKVFEWEELIDWMDEGIPVDSVETWELQPKTELTEGAKSDAGADSPVAD